MEAIGLATSIITVVLLTGSCLKIGSKFLGPSKHNSKHLAHISSDLYNLNGSIVNLQMHYILHEEDEVRLTALSHLEEPLKRCIKGRKSSKID